jgi:hypothetical protein
MWTGKGPTNFSPLQPNFEIDLSKQRQTAGLSLSGVSNQSVACIRASVAVRVL